MYRLQETEWAHVSPADHQFKTVSRHRTLDTAKRAYGVHYKRMKKICGIGAWDHHHRIIDDNNNICDPEEGTY